MIPNKSNVVGRLKAALEILDKAASEARMTRARHYEAEVAGTELRQYLGSLSQVEPKALAGNDETRTPNDEKSGSKIV